MGGACSMHGRDEKWYKTLVRRFGLKARNHLEDLNINRRIIFKWILEK